MSAGEGAALIYVSRVDIMGGSGQGSFERGIIEALLRSTATGAGRDVRIFSVASRPASGPFLDDRLTFIRLDSETALGYLAHQVRLTFALFGALRQLRGSRLILFARFSPTMVAPLLVAFLTRCRFIYRTGPVLPSVRAYRGETRGWVLRGLMWLSALYANKAHRIVVATEAIAAWVRQAHPRAAQKVIVIPNAVNVATLRQAPRDRSRWGLAEDGFVAGYVGSLIPEQGLDTVLCAMAHIPAHECPHLLVVGAGPMAESWRALADELGIASRVTWFGPVPHQQVPSAFAACDVLIMPLTAATIEVRGTSATKLFEYLACDKPVLASRCSDLLFLESHGVGHLLEADDPQAWAAGLRAARAARTDLGGRGRDLVTRLYTYDAVAETIWSLGASQSLEADPA